MRLSALSAVAAAVTLLATPASAILGFNYSACAPAGQEDPSLAIGSTAYVCLSFNGATTSVWQIKVDQFTALQVIGCECGARLGVEREGGDVGSAVRRSGRRQPAALPHHPSNAHRPCCHTLPAPRSQLRAARRERPAAAGLWLGAQCDAGDGQLLDAV